MASIPTFENLIDGGWTASHSNAVYDDVNPANTEDIVARFQDSDLRDMEDARNAARAAQAAWQAATITSRARLLLTAADLLDARADEFGLELSREEGKPVAKGKGEFNRAAQVFRFYAIEGQTYTGETFWQDDPNLDVYSVREPIGTVAVITPWNFPASIPARKIAPALITGNTVVFKPSTDTPMAGYRLVEALVDAGLPGGVLNFVTGRASKVGIGLTQTPEIDGITFTGSTKAGEEISAHAPMTTRLQMELGGKNPLLVMQSADLDLAVDLTVRGGLSLSGQACTGTGRVLVDKHVLEEYTQRLVDRVKSLKIGSGTTDGMDIGPLATRQQLNSVQAYIEVGKEEATHLWGGDTLDGPDYENGYFVSPAIFTAVPRDARIAREEIFGPVVVIIPVDGYDDAIKVANDTIYGLSASIVTQDMVEARRFCHEINAGTVKVNRTTTGNLVNAPFGGIKRSSTATFRESGRVGLEFFLQTKTVYRGV